MHLFLSSFVNSSHLKAETLLFGGVKTLETAQHIRGRNWGNADQPIVSFHDFVVIIIIIHLFQFLPLQTCFDVSKLDIQRVLKFTSINFARSCIYRFGWFWRFSLGADTRVSAFFSHEILLILANQIKFLRFADCVRMENNFTNVVVVCFFFFLVLSFHIFACGVFPL